MKRAFGLTLLLAASLTVFGFGALAACDSAQDENPDSPPPSTDVPAPQPEEPVPPTACERLGEHYPADDTCNWCTCSDDGVETCTARTCVASNNTCDYNGVTFGYAERFAATDGCNECVCAASGLACTRRACASGDENSAILLESLDASCGDDPTFTGNALLGYLAPSYEADLDYNQASGIYPETLADARVAVHVAYDGGFVVCRPLAGQEAIDMEAKLEVVSSDGALNEGVHAYLRRIKSVFTDNVHVLASVAAYDDLHGTYSPGCADLGSLLIDATFEADGSARGGITKVCGLDMALVVAEWAQAAN